MRRRFFPVGCNADAIRNSPIPRSAHTVLLHLGKSRQTVLQRFADLIWKVLDFHGSLFLCLGDGVCGHELEHYVH